MPGFVEAENSWLAAYKASSSRFSAAARSDGLYRGKRRPYCLPVRHARENLYPGIRDNAIAYFAAHEIKWHDGKKDTGDPSHHLRDSQVCCVNFLFPFADKPRALANVLRPVFPDLSHMLPVEDGLYVSFERIGQKNYLGEILRGPRQRTRGALYTSADAVVMFQQTDGRRQMVLIEWKYTETYYSSPKYVGSSGAIRLEVYRPLYDQSDCPINKERVPSFESLFYEPFYQMMRQQFLAHEMEKAHELCADLVSVLHIAPAANRAFQWVTSPELRSLGKTATGVWNSLVQQEDRFKSTSTEQIFGLLTARHVPDMQDWIEYIHERYTWIGGEG